MIITSITMLINYAKRISEKEDGIRERDTNRNSVYKSWGETLTQSSAQRDICGIKNREKAKTQEKRKFR